METARKPLFIISVLTVMHHLELFNCAPFAKIYLQMQLTTGLSRLQWQHCTFMLSILFLYIFFVRFITFYVL